jgi:hypothetical protein
MKIVREIKDGTGFVCFVVFVSQSFVVVDQNGQDAVIFHTFSRGRSIVQIDGKIGFSDKFVGTPSRGNKLFVYVEEFCEEGKTFYVVTDWGFNCELENARKVLEKRQSEEVMQSTAADTSLGKLMETENKAA